MAFTTLSLGLTLTIPTVGTKNWGPTVYSTTWTKISQHAHTGSGDGNPIGTAALIDRSITSIKLEKNVNLTQATTLTPAGNTQTIDLNDGNIQTLDLDTATGDVTVTLSNPKTGASYKIMIIQAASPLDVIWPANVKWPQAQKPILSQTDNAVDFVELYYNGTNYLGQWDLDFS